MRSINIIAGITLITWQKIIPLFLLRIPQLSFKPLVLTLAAVRALWGSIAGLNQTNIISLLTFSSIAHSRWLISASLLRVKTLFMYLTSYTLTLIPIFMIINSSNIKTHKTIICIGIQKYPQITITLRLLSLAGLPPLAIFSNKIPVIILMTKAITTLAFILIGAAIRLCFYVIIVFTTIFNLSESLKPANTKFTIKLICVITALLQFSTLPLMLYSLP